MNNFRKEKGLRLAENETDLEKITDILKEEGFTNEEIFEVIEAIKSGAKPAPQKAAKSEEVATSPNAKLDLSGFNYRELRGEEFRKYVQLVGDRNYIYMDPKDRRMKAVTPELRQDDVYDFELYKVEVFRVERFPGMDNSPVDFDGLRIKDNQAIHTTRITVAQAVEFNAQILNQHGIAGHGKYYFLKKTK